jgi:hypothetical protein
MRDVTLQAVSILAFTASVAKSFRMAPAFFAWERRLSDGIEKRRAGKTLR